MYHVMSTKSPWSAVAASGTKMSHGVISGDTEVHFNNALSYQVSLQYIRSNTMGSVHYDTVLRCYGSGIRLHPVKLPSTNK
ncbi:hypothetical protein TNCT_735501 [Trichonephila clavata]|uniref:Uncharacterized protein n=1 Tax=Trichonephila clavata TaxID=2740835 RepID=A0A8X6HH06_TRICU|nr:hypothetical protein TNCT_735501 [Trichonephila clavata]